MCEYFNIAMRSSSPSVLSSMVMFWTEPNLCRTFHIVKRSGHICVIESDLVEEYFNVRLT